MVFVDFAVLPPEVISGQIYAGPGAESLQAAAAAWQRLAGELQSTAASYSSVISELVGESWAGTSSVLMAAAAAPYVAWISTTAAQAEETASHALSAASAYETALAATVPPAVVAANRTRLAALLATNIFGQNGAAIAATEADYGQMWSQDVAAMFGYAASSEAAGDLTPFTGPPAIAKDTGEVSQAAAASSPTSTVSSWLQQIERYIDSLALGYDKFWEGLIEGVTGNSEIAPLYESLYSSLSGVSSQARWLNIANTTVGVGILEWKNFFVYKPGIAGIAKSTLGAGLAAPGRVAPFGAVKPVSAALASAPTVGALSVPPSWATATPAIRLAATVLPATSVAAAPASELLTGMVNEGTLGSFAGGALGNSRARVVSSSTGIQTRAITGERLKGPVKLDSVIAQLQEHPDKVQHWSVDEAGLDELVARLRTTPGVHAVHVLDDQQTTVTPSQPQRG